MATMISFVLRILIVALGLWLAARIVPGISIRDGETLLLSALILGIVNAFLRPLVILLTLPLTLITLGLFILVINAAMLGLVAMLLPGLGVRGVGAAFWGALVVSVVSWFASIFVGKRGRRIWRPAHL
jgi:putative membrane protein